MMPARPARLLIASEWQELRSDLALRGEAEGMTRHAVQTVDAIALMAQRGEVLPPTARYMLASAAIELAPEAGQVVPVRSTAGVV